VDIVLESLDINRKIQPRSLLTSIEPIVTPEWGRECVPSYINRLARYNDWRPGDLLALLFSQRFGSGKNIAQTNSKNQQAQIRLAIDPGLIKIMTDQLKHHVKSDAPSQAFTSDIEIILSHIETGKPTIYKWCSHCFYEQETPYVPIQWLLTKSRVCHKHYIELTSVCSDCERKPNLIKRDTVVGYCDHCGTFLGKSENSVKNSPSMNADTEKHYALLLADGYYSE